MIEINTKQVTAMRKYPQELHEKIRKYSLMMAWWYIHEKEKDMKDKFEKVLKKIEQTEDELRTSGVKGEVFDEIIERAKRFVNMPISDMNDNQRLTMCKLIFGQQTEYA